MRLIDADAVKRRMHETMDYQELYLPVHFEMCMNDAPTVEPASPWHRVEDGLPEEFDTVIVCGRMKYDHEKDYEVFVDVGEYGPYDYSHDRWATWNDWYEGQEEFKITHWMPLPEPPKEDEQ